MADEPTTEEAPSDAADTAEDIEAQEALAEAVAAAENDTGEGEADEPESEDSDDDDTFDAARARRKIKKANAEARRQRERAKAAEDRAAGLEPAQREAALQRVARRLELPDNPRTDEFLARLQGNTVEELAQDAESLLTLVAPKEPRMPAPNPAQGADTAPPRDPTPQELAAQKAQEGDWAAARQIKTDILLGLHDKQ